MATWSAMFCSHLYFMLSRSLMKINLLETEFFRVFLVVYPKHPSRGNNAEQLAVEFHTILESKLKALYYLPSNPPGRLISLPKHRSRLVWFWLSTPTVGGSHHPFQLNLEPCSMFCLMTKYVLWLRCYHVKLLDRNFILRAVPRPAIISRVRSFKHFFETRWRLLRPFLADRF